MASHFPKDSLMASNCTFARPNYSVLRVEGQNLTRITLSLSSDPIRLAEMAFERAAEAAARAALQAEEEEEQEEEKPILPYSSFFILSSTNP